MADTREFFERYMPEKLAHRPELAASVNAVYQFDVRDAGTWTLDLTSRPGVVREGVASAPGCVITISRADWERLLDQPGLVTMLMMQGKLKTTNVGLALQLQKIIA